MLNLNQLYTVEKLNQIMMEAQQMKEALFLIIKCTLFNLVWNTRLKTQKVI